MNQQIEMEFVRLFKTRGGKMVLDYLRSVTVERALGIDATDGQIRYLEGQRALVKQIENLIKRGEKND